MARPTYWAETWMSPVPWRGRLMVHTAYPSKVRSGSRPVDEEDTARRVRGGGAGDGCVHDRVRHPPDQRRPGRGGKGNGDGHQDDRRHDAANRGAKKASGHDSWVGVSVGSLDRVWALVHPKDRLGAGADAGSTLPNVSPSAAPGS